VLLASGEPAAAPAGCLHLDEARLEAEIERQAGADVRNRDAEAHDGGVRVGLHDVLGPHALSDAWLMCFGAVEKSARMRLWTSMNARNSAREKTKRTRGCAVPRPGL
jgi:hypothetical protein